MVLVQDPFYRHDSLGPGAPLREITGSSDQAGYYDWAGRRLFMRDGEPDPMCPGAYRYQHNRDCCDLEAPDSDPRSPRYEPMHLRHKPGDTWIIDTNRPHDPYDPGPYGSYGWYKDERTGRHRRDELPDPLPAEGWVPPEGAWFPGTADWPEPAASQQEPARLAERPGGRGDSQGRGGGEPQRTSGEQGGSDRPPPWGRRGRPVPSPDDDEGDEGHRAARRPWDRTETGCGPGDAGWISGYGGHQSQSEHGDRDRDRDRDPDHGDNGRNGADTGGEYRFSKLREDAFERFMIQSARLRAAHFRPEEPYLRERAAWVLRWLLWVFALGLAPMPTPLVIRQCQVEPAVPQAIPQQSGLAARPQHRPLESTPRPGAALAAPVGGARAARSVIASRTTRTSDDLAAAVRDSAFHFSAAHHWRARPLQARPRPAPRPEAYPVSRPAPGSYMTAWEHAFDTSATFILSTGAGGSIGATA
jgi:hypothetical protein